ncbi:MAG: hypothetical protein N2110_03830 [Flavobacteriales bacterium]|nr:hypothetical protein [Flavobacteriales bacterium]MCX7768139.1 hypothetical protein [Flavobacteriales bacterium]MDW8409569.1 hypothetical protein [Flavobacteriales bacterium]
MKHLASWIGVQVLLLSVLASCQKGPAWLLRIRPKLGDTLHYLINIHQKLHTMGIDMRQHYRIYQNVSFSRFYGDSAFDLTSSIQRIIIHQWIPVADTVTTFYFDSQKPDSVSKRFDIIGRVFKEVVGKEFNIRVTSTGRVIQSDFERVWKKVVLPGSTLPGSSPMVLSKNTTLEQFLASLPQRPVRKGDTYIVTSQLGLAPELPLNTNTQFTVESLTDAGVVLRYSAHFNSPDTGRYENFFKGHQNGYCLLDGKSLMVRTNAYMQQAQMNLSILGYRNLVNTHTFVATYLLP